MPSTITSITPNTGKPGDTVTIIGAGFVAGIDVEFSGAGRSKPGASVTVVDAQHVSCVVPDVFDGLVGDAAVSVCNAADVPSLTCDFSILARIPLDSVVPLCPLGFLKATLSIAPDETAQDANLQALINIASIQIAAYCQREFQRMVITGELQDGDGTAMLTPDHLPIMSVQALAIDTQPVDPSDMNVYPMFVKLQDDGGYNPRLLLGSRIFPRGNQNVSISYTAGYEYPPADIVNACANQAMFLQALFAKQGLLSEINQVANATTYYSQLPMSPMARVACNRYRKTSVTAI